MSYLPLPIAAKHSTTTPNRITSIASVPLHKCNTAAMKCNDMNSTSYRDEHFHLRESSLSQDAHIQSCQINMALQDRQRRRTSTAPASPFPETEEPAAENNPPHHHQSKVKSHSYAKVLIHPRKYSYRRRSTAFMFGSLSLSNPIVFCAVLLLYANVILMASPLVSAADLMGKTEGRFAPLLDKKGKWNVRRMFMLRIRIRIDINSLIHDSFTHYS